MRFYTQQHQYYCGIDLHARTMYACVLDAAGDKLVHRNIPAQPASLFRLLEPCRPDVVIGVECIFTWYWIADLCEAERLPFPRPTVSTCLSASPIHRWPPASRSIWNSSTPTTA